MESMAKKIFAKLVWILELSIWIGRDPFPPQTIRLFKPNILFKSFEMKDSVDRVLVYVTLYIVGEKKSKEVDWNWEFVPARKKFSYSTQDP